MSERQLGVTMKIYDGLDREALEMLVRGQRGGSQGLDHSTVKAKARKQLAAVKRREEQQKAGRLHQKSSKAYWMRSIGVQNVHVH